MPVLMTSLLGFNLAFCVCGLHQIWEILSVILLNMPFLFWGNSNYMSLNQLYIPQFTEVLKKKKLPLFCLCFALSSLWIGATVFKCSRLFGLFFFIV